MVCLLWNSPFVRDRTGRLGSVSASTARLFKIYPRLVQRPRCENCGLVTSEDTESDIVGITKTVSAGVKTGDKDTLVMVGVAVVGVLLLFSVIAGWWK